MESYYFSLVDEFEIGPCDEVFEEVSDLKESYQENTNENVCKFSSDEFEIGSGYEDFEEVSDLKESDIENTSESVCKLITGDLFNKNPTFSNYDEFEIGPGDEDFEVSDLEELDQKNLSESVCKLTTGDLFNKSHTFSDDDDFQIGPGDKDFEEVSDLKDSDQENSSESVCKLTTGDHINKNNTFSNDDKFEIGPGDEDFKEVFDVKESNQENTNESVCKLTTGDLSNNNNTFSNEDEVDPGDEDFEEVSGLKESDQEKTNKSVYKSTTGDLFNENHTFSSDEFEICPDNEDFEEVSDLKESEQEDTNESVCKLTTGDLFNENHTFSSEVTAVSVDMIETRTSVDADFEDINKNLCKLFSERSNHMIETRTSVDANFININKSLCEIFSEKMNEGQTLCLNEKTDSLSFSVIQKGTSIDAGDSYKGTVSNNSLGCEGASLYNKNVINKCADVNCNVGNELSLNSYSRVNNTNNDVMFKCRFCNYETRRKIYLVTHVESYHNENDNSQKFKCPHCAFRTHYKVSLNHHVRNKHAVSGTFYKCKFCQFLTKRESTLEIHVKMKHYEVRRIFICAECKFRSKSKKNLKHHIKMKHMNKNSLNNNSSYQCKFCQYKTTWKYYLARHVTLKHDENCDFFKCSDCSFKTKYKSSLEQHVALKHEGTQIKKIYKCKLCDYAAIRKPYLRIHIKAKHKYDNKYQSNFNNHFKRKHKSNSDLSNTISKHKLPTRADSETKNKTHLEEHTEGVHDNIEALKHAALIHDNNEFLSQPKCEMKNNNAPSELIQIRGNYRTFKCSECIFESKYRFHLKQHVRKKHKMILQQLDNVLVLKSNNCALKINKCSGYVTKNDSLRADNVQQENYEKFKCFQCNFETKYKSSLKMHVQSQHKTNIESNDTHLNVLTLTKSDLTPKSYSKRKIKKKINNKIHKCRYCNVKTVSKAYLAIHQKTEHSNCFVPFQCNECEFVTKYQSSLIFHVKTQHRNIVHKCKFCQFQTKCKTNFTNHFRIRHQTSSDNCVFDKYSQLCNIFKCPNCDFHTKWYSSLKQHITKKHQSLTSFKCENCDYVTSWKYDLEKHVKFEHKTYFKDHIQTGHNNSKVLKYGDIRVKKHNNSDLSNTISKHKLSAHVEREHEIECPNFVSETKNEAHLKEHAEGVLDNSEVLEHTDLTRESNSNSSNTISKHKLPTHVEQEHKIECPNFDSETKNEAHSEEHTEVVLDGNEALKHTDLTYESNSVLSNTISKHKLPAHVDQEHKIECPSFDSEAKTKAHLKEHTEGMQDNNEVSELTDLTCVKNEFHSQPECDEYGIKNKNASSELIKVQGNCQKFKCSECIFESKYRFHLKQHVRKKHKVTLQPLGNTLMLKSNNCALKMNECSGYVTKNNFLRADKIQQENYKKFKCFHCIFETNYKNSLKIHVLSQHKINIESNDTHLNVLKLTKSDLTPKSYLKRKIKKKINNKVHECRYCNFKSVWKCNLAIHQKTEHSNCFVPFKCTKCEYVTKYKSNLTVHVKLKHTNDVYKCKFCKFQTKYKITLTNHFRMHHQTSSDNCLSDKYNQLRNMFKCSKCNFKTKRYGFLKQHIRKKHQSSPSFNNCDFEKYDLETHVKSKHKVYLKDQIQTGHNNSEVLKYGDVCDVDNEFLSEAHCSKQNNVETIEYSEDKIIKNNSFMKHVEMKEENGKTFKCSQCPFATKYRHYLKQHVQRRHRINVESHVNTHSMSKVTNCDLKIKLKTYSNPDKRTSLQSKKVYKCTYCNFKTVWKNSFTEHQYAKHTKNFVPLECKECDFVTKYRANLTSHVKRNHSERVIYKCSFCEFQTKYKSSLKQHVLIQHQTALSANCVPDKYDRLANLFKCPSCDFETNWRSYLKTHIKLKHQTPISHNSKNSDTSLQHESTKYTTEHNKLSEVLECPNCEFKTKWKSYLKQHIRIKHDKFCTTFKCSSCDFVTKYKSYFKYHTEKYHDNSNNK